MIIEIALGIVLGVILLYLLPFFFALLLKVIPILLIIGVVVFGISIIPNEWIQYVHSNVPLEYLLIIIVFTITILTASVRFFQSFKGNPITLKQLSHDEITSEMFHFGFWIVFSVPFGMTMLGDSMLDGLMWFLGYWCFISVTYHLNQTDREQYLKRREIRLAIIRQYESQNETELTQEEIDMIDNDPQLQG